MVDYWQDKAEIVTPAMADNERALEDAYYALVLDDSNPALRDRIAYHLTFDDTWGQGEFVRWHAGVADLLTEYHAFRLGAAQPVRLEIN